MQTFTSSLSIGMGVILGGLRLVLALFLISVTIILLVLMAVIIVPCVIFAMLWYRVKDWANGY